MSIHDQVDQIIAETTQKPLCARDFLMQTSAPFWEQATIFVYQETLPDGSTLLLHHALLKATCPDCRQVHVLSALVRETSEGFSLLVPVREESPHLPGDELC